MKKPVTIFSALLFLAVTATLFNNCSKVDFAPVSTEASSLGEVAPPPTGDIQEVVTNCQNAAASGKLLQVSTEVKFADSRTETGLTNICSAIKDGSNYEIFKGNGYAEKLAARYEQKKALSLPANAVICDLKLENDLSSFKYDDVFYLTFNGYVLASNLKTSILQRLDNDEVKIPSKSQFTKLYKYDWLKLRGAGFGSSADDYCLGADQSVGSCTWPITDQQGSIKIAWSPELLIALSLASKNAAQEFKFITTGDDDPSSDCFHQELKFQTTVKYYLSQ